MVSIVKNSTPILVISIKKRSQVHTYAMYSSVNTKPCNLVLRVGLKGSGKTFTGAVLEKYLDIK